MPPRDRNDGNNNHPEDDGARVPAPVRQIRDDIPPDVVVRRIHKCAEGIGRHYSLAAGLQWYNTNPLAAGMEFGACVIVGILMAYNTFFGDACSEMELEQIYGIITTSHTVTRSLVEDFDNGCSNFRNVLNELQVEEDVDYAHLTNKGTLVHMEKFYLAMLKTLDGFDESVHTTGIDMSRAVVLEVVEPDS
mmetsp:Transcript_30456/g.50611  ORF Transcript_30456/g.50611 Transcript_30456/m.50611 type:complete len:191 (-) Transcript_30456:1110-1682(-)|eukprot:CAMPEP_0178744510 /NCGR_PEP_ID=MMETSP0744-20121128/6811_1 /TAXON_ID=913974 /ORGANISM="Nitzschia punctata, Strain CCMP561" /LENGTH=190 /DNA_ID=CAMNT_0020397653 /DNA_START=240 /DNA_END=812 /DNA_ORIENTATION=-